MINKENPVWKIKPIYTMYQVCKYLLFSLKIAIANFHDWKNRLDSTNIHAPPPRLRHRVVGRLDKGYYLRSGENTAQCIRNLVELVDRDLYSFENILDFGCGPGRILRNFQDGPASCQFYGTDIDLELISWCKKSLPNIQLSTNTHKPPLSFFDNTFDLIYAVSVFTHLNREFQYSWLSELRRIAKPGATIILTVHGRHIANKLPALQQSRVHSDGFLFLTGVTGKLRLNKLPDYYQSAYHTKEYIYREWSAYFDVVHYIERGIDNQQDAVILRK